MNNFSTEKTQPFFIVSSGRSGTQMITKFFEQFENVDMHHQYMINIFQPIATQYHMGLISKKDVCDKLLDTYKSSIFYSEKEFWGDSAHNISWIIDCLNEVFPNAKFVHLVRDGRKVVSSWYNKLSDECYDDKSNLVLENWVKNPKKFPKPPPEKKYWWNIPISKNNEYNKFKKYDQFGRICFHWKEVNRVIIQKFEKIENSRKRMYKLEELIKSPKKVEELTKFLGIKFDETKFEVLKKPHNVNVPIDFGLDEKQKKVFFKIAGAMMEKLEYNNTKEYTTKYK